MPCNFLMRFNDEKKYEHYIIEGCQNSGSPAQAVVKYFLDRYTTVTVSNFAEEVEKLSADQYVWCKYLQGVAIFEELYEILPEKRFMLKNSHGGSDPNNLIPVTALSSKIIKSNPAQLLPYFSGDV